MGELGNRLREAREQRGLSLAHVEEVTRIRRAFLEAIEEERFVDLPADVYARGFIRNYAHFLGLDAEPLIAAYRKATGIPPTRIPQVLDQPLLQRPGSARAWIVGLVCFVVIAGLALAGWYAYERFDVGSWISSALRASQRPTATPWSTPHTPTLPPRQAPAEPTSTLALATSAAPGSSLVASSTPTERPTERATATPTVTFAATAPATLTLILSATPTTGERATNTPSATAPPAGAIRVQGNVSAPTYLEVTVDGQRVYTGILSAGEERMWTGQRSVALLVGNAGGLKLTVNGVEVPPLGREGEVVTVSYTPDNLPRR